MTGTFHNLAEGNETIVILTAVKLKAHGKEIHHCFDLFQGVFPLLQIIKCGKNMYKYLG